MSATKKQIRANRENAKKSTGPITNEGKATVAKNNTKHGLYARDLIINAPGLQEDEEEFNSLAADIYDDFLPVGFFEKYLVDKIIVSLWRSRRAAKAEAAAVNCQLRRTFKSSVHGDTMSEEEEEHDDRDHFTAQSIPHSSTSANILRYELRLDRQLARTYALLLCLQARRKSEMIEGLKRKEFKYTNSKPIPFNGKETNDIQEILKITD
jgi:hypothetical protein